MPDCIVVYLDHFKIVRFFVYLSRDFIMLNRPMYATRFSYQKGQRPERNDLPKEAIGVWRLPNPPGSYEGHYVLLETYVMLCRSIMMDCLERPLCKSPFYSAWGW